MEPLSDQFNNDQLMKDFKSVVADVEALLKATADTGGDKLAEVRARAEASLDAVKATIGDTQESVLAKTKEVAKATDDYVQENPWRSIGLAACVGLVIGLLISRR
ncbi:MAG: YqjD family protein [Sulfuritalea sp.]|jgi:ElaB/YqjD/DUF883 family membrane-anchored ribosome-binding protein|nr:YqjD family protein [Sulfuritalea sp.]